MSDLLDAWWQGAAEHRLLVQRCGRCGAYQHYPRPVCLACSAGELELVEASGQGRVWSYTEVVRAPAPDIAVPYTVALVRLAEGPVLLTHLDYPDPSCDDSVVVVSWPQPAQDSVLPVFTRADQAAR